MKKIILGCAAVLLSLGLLAGCNNEESDKAVSIKVDTAATVVVGESLSLPYTVEPEKADIEVLNNHEEYVTAVAQEGTLYLEGVAEGSATVTLVGTYKKYTEANVSIAVSVVTESTADTGPGEEEPGDTGETEPGEQAITLSVDPIETALIAGGDPVEITYSVTPTEAEDGIDMVVEDTDVATVAYTDGWYLTPVAEGETTLTVTATLEEYETASVVIDIVVHEEGWTEPEPEPFNSYTLIVTLKLGETTTNFPTAEDPYNVYMQSAYDSWGNDNNVAGTGHLMTNNNDGTYTYVFDTLPDEAGWYETNIYAGNADGISWTHKLGTFSWEITGEESGDEVCQEDIKVQDYTTWEEIFPEHSGSTDVYVVIFEAQTNIGSSVLTTNIVKVAGGRNSDQGSTTAFFSGATESDVTSGTNGSDSQPYVYNTTAATVEAEYKSDAWFTAYDGGSWTHKVECSKLGTPMGEIPDVEDGHIAVFSAVYNSSEPAAATWAWAATTGISDLSGGWCLTATSISDFFSTCVTGTVN